jgi:tryptophan-rich sensory protein
MWTNLDQVSLIAWLSIVCFQFWTTGDSYEWYDKARELCPSWIPARSVYAFVWPIVYAFITAAGFLYWSNYELCNQTYYVASSACMIALVLLLKSYTVVFFGMGLRNLGVAICIVSFGLCANLVWMIAAVTHGAAATTCDVNLASGIVAYLLLIPVTVWLIITIYVSYMWVMFELPIPTQKTFSHRPMAAEETSVTTQIKAVRSAYPRTGDAKYI